MFKKIFSELIALSLVFTVTGCAAAASPEVSALASITTEVETSTNIQTDNVTSTNVLFTTNEYKYSDEDTNTEYTDVTANILLGDNATTVSGEGATAVGSFVEISSGGTFVLSGKLTDGQIAINAPATATVRLILNGVDITSSKNSAIYCMQANKLIITLTKNTENILSDAENYTYVDASSEEPDATLFSKKDLSINGLGTLTINSNFNNGIGTKDDLIIASGNINVTSVNNAIRGRDSVLILGGNFNLNSQNDGLQSNNDEDVSKGGIVIEDGVFNIKSDHDAIQAETTIKISGGEFNLTSGLGNTVFHEEVVETEGVSNSYKGIKASGNFVIEGGVFKIDSADDSLHSNSNIQILNGDFTLSTGDDAVHADTSVHVVDGNINVLVSVEGLEGKVVTVDGGNIDITSSDDAINASDGSTTTTEQMGRGEMPEGFVPPTDGEMPEGFVPPTDGEMPTGERMPRPETGERITGEGTPPAQSPMGNERVMDNGIEIYINGGILKIDAEGDAIDSNGNAIITGGELYINGPSTGGNGILDADGSFDITGGLIIGTENSDGSSASSSSTQPSFTLYFSELKTAGKVIKIKSAAGKELATFTPSKDFKVLLVSTPDLKLNETYYVYLDDIKVVDITLSKLITLISDTGEAVEQRMGGFNKGAGGPKNK